MVRGAEAVHRLHRGEMRAGDPALQTERRMKPSGAAPLIPALSRPEKR